MKSIARKSVFLGGAAILALTVFGIMQPADAHCHDHWRHERWERYHNAYYGNQGYYPAAYPTHYYPQAYPGYYGQPGLMTRMLGRW